MKIYLAVELSSKFRWISASNKVTDWGLKLNALRGELITGEFGSIDVEWSRETIKRPICDFPNFRTNIKCMSVPAYEAFRDLIGLFGQWINMEGLPYIAFYCTNIIDCALVENNLESLPEDFHAVRFAPKLKIDPLKSVPIFRIPQSISKIFVNHDFKNIYDKSNFTGLEFIEVSLM